MTTAIPSKAVSDAAPPSAAAADGAFAPEPFLECIPTTLRATLAALKLQPRLEGELRAFCEAAASVANTGAFGDGAEKGDGGDRDQAAFSALEKRARPILLDVGAGKKGAGEILEQWRLQPMRLSRVKEGTKFARYA